MLFKDSMACISGVHCSTCRDKENGRAFRVSLGNVFVMPEGGTDFECPHGKEWGNIDAQPIPIVSKEKRGCGCSRVVAEISSDKILSSKERLDICEDCAFMSEHKEWMYCEYEDRHINLNVISTDPMKDCPIGSWNKTNNGDK